MKTKVWKLSSLVLLLVLLWSCRKGEPVEPMVPDVGSVTGFYLLNEGTMSHNNATLDYCDLFWGRYGRNVYTMYNPDVPLGLGDTGNDLAIYGTKLYAVITGSNKLEVMRMESAKRIKKIDINQPRSIAFAGGKVYVTAYDGTGIEPGTSNGMVVEIDTATLEITRRVLVGTRPEGLAVVGNRLYVANSVIFDEHFVPTYDNRLSVIDLESFTKVNDITVAGNMKWVKPDAYGNLYVSSLGADTPPALYVVNTTTETVVNTFDIPASNFCMSGDSVLVLGTSYDADYKPTYSYTLINAETQTVVPGGFIHDGTDANIKAPYGIAVDPTTKNIYLTDAGDYSSPGKLYGFSPAGKLLLWAATGVVPAHFAFVYYQ